MKTFRKIPKRYLKRVLQEKEAATCLYFFWLPQGIPNKKIGLQIFGHKHKCPLASTSDHGVMVIHVFISSLASPSEASR